MKTVINTIAVAFLLGIVILLGIAVIGWVINFIGTWFGVVLFVAVLLAMAWVIVSVD